MQCTEWFQLALKQFCSEISSKVKEVKSPSEFQLDNPAVTDIRFPWLQMLW